MIHSTFRIQKTKFHLIAERLPQRSATLLVAEKVPLGKKIVSEIGYPQSYYSWFSRYVIAAMLVDGKQKIAH